jgi:hypothetical protein
MTISIKLNPTIFDPGGLFEGIIRNRAVLHLGVGRDDTHIGKINQGTAANLSYRGGQTNFQIDCRGTELTDQSFEFIAQNQGYQIAYLAHLIDFMERGLVQVFQDGVLLTVTQVRAFTA